MHQNGAGAREGCGRLAYRAPINRAPPLEVNSPDRRAAATFDALHAAVLEAQSLLAAVCAAQSVLPAVFALSQVEALAEVLALSQQAALPAVLALSHSPAETVRVIAMATADNETINFFIDQRGGTGGVS